MTKWREAFERGRPSECDIEHRHKYAFGPPATEEDIARVEGELGVRLPAEVRELLSEFNGVWETRSCGRPIRVYLDAECMRIGAQEYIRYGGDPPITPSGADLRKIVYVAQMNGFADLYGVCLEPIGGFPVGAVVKLDHEAWELRAAAPNLMAFVERFLK